VPILAIQPAGRGPHPFQLTQKQSRFEHMTLIRSVQMHADPGSARKPVVACTVVLFSAAAVVGATAATLAADELDIRIGYLRLVEQRATLSPLQMPAENGGVAGAKLGIEDNNTTGKFLNQRFSLDEVRLDPTDDPQAAVTALAGRGARLIVADLPADALLKAADAGGEGVLFNASATDDRLREEDCRGNVVHVAPTRSMLADGLAQYLVWMQWRRWLMVVGSHPPDKLYADALRRAARRFGAKIVEERVFEDTGGARRSDSGVVQVQRQIPVF